MSKGKGTAPFTAAKGKTAAPAAPPSQRPRPPAAPRVNVRSKASSRGR
jgi:hypothetical protein